MARRLLLPALLVVAALLAGRVVASTVLAPETAGDPLEGRVERVVDGDTVRVDLPDDDRTVRVIGVDTPEVAHDGRPGACYGDEARAFVRSVLDGRRVRLTIGVEERDRFGRTLATVRVLDGPAAGRDLSLALARGGYARALAIAPNTANAREVARAVAEARRARRGLWGTCGAARAFPGRG